MLPPKTRAPSRGKATRGQNLPKICICPGAATATHVHRHDRDGSAVAAAAAGARVTGMTPMLEVPRRKVPRGPYQWYKRVKAPWRPASDS